MKPIIQKNIHNEEKGIVGDCLRACICSLLEISDKGVPNFAEDKDYPQQLNEFLFNKGYELIYTKKQPKNIDYYMVYGISPRGLNHAVIYYKGKIIHDPHPKGGGVVPYVNVYLKKIDNL